MLSQPDPVLTSERSDAPRWLSDLLAIALAAAPEQRLPDAAAFHTALTQES